MNLYQTKVRTLSHKGHGVIDHPEHGVLFVKGAWIDEDIEVEITSTKKYSFVQLTKILKASPYRVEPLCPHQGLSVGKCGGCPWQMIQYEEQLRAKEIRVQFLLSKNKIPVSAHTIRPILASEKSWGYRNRAQWKTNGQEIGYVSEGTNELAPIENCLVVNDRLQTLLSDIKKTLPRDDYRPAPPYYWNFLDVDDDLRSEKEVILNQRGPFRQGNSFQNKMMKQWLKEKVASLPETYQVMELYAGSGNLTQVLLERGFKTIFASEYQDTALNQIALKKSEQLKTLRLDMNARDAWEQLKKKMPHPDLLVLDPPREGVEKRLGLFKNFPNLKKVIYISCEPESWSRDLQDFIAHGWRVEEVTPLDMFPQTPHVEILSVLSKN